VTLAADGQTGRRGRARQCCARVGQVRVVI